MIRTLREDWRGTLAVVSGGHFLSHFYYLTLPPLFPLLRTEFGLNNTELGLLVSVLTVGGLMQAPVGNVVDRVGAKRILVAGIGVTAGGIALLGIGPTYPALLALAVVSGLGQSAFHPADYAMIEGVTDPDVRGRAFSIHTFSGFAGFAAAPVVVGTLGLTAGWRVALFAVGGVGLLYAVFAAVALAPAYRGTGTDETDGTDGASGTDDDGSATPGTDGSFRAAIRNPGILAMVGFFLVMALAGKGVQTFTAVLATNAFGLEESVGNTLLTVYFTLGSIGILVGGVLADRYAPGRVITGGLLVGATVLLVTVVGLLPVTPLLLVALFGLIGFFVSIVAPSRDRLVSEVAGSGSMGQSFGIVFTGATVGSLVGPVLLGAVGDAASITLSFVLIGAFFLAAGALAFSLGQGWLTPGTGPTATGGD